MCGCLVGQPSISDLRAFVLDRNAYWGDEIALRVFADAFKIVVCVVLQVGLACRCQPAHARCPCSLACVCLPWRRCAHLIESSDRGEQVEERLQVVFPTKGGAQALFYLVLTHRGAVPHYRSVSVGDRHVLPLHEMSNTGCDGQAYVTPGMVARLCEDCPHGWDANLSPEALSFFMGRCVSWSAVEGGWMWCRVRLMRRGGAREEEHEALDSRGGAGLPGSWLEHGAGRNPR